MALLTEKDVASRATRAMVLRKATASAILTESRKSDDTFDVFLSHSSAEPEEILLGIKSYLEDEGLTVYVDKYTDPHLSHEHVTDKTARVLRGRLRASKSLLYVYSRHSRNSRWMPWELGFMDGADRQVGIIPVVQQYQTGFVGEEYLGLYPYVDRTTLKGNTKEIFWINRSPGEYAQLSPWIRGNMTITRR